MSDSLIRLFVPLNERVHVQDLRNIVAALVDKYGGATILRGTGHWVPPDAPRVAVEDCAVVEVLVPTKYESAQDQITEPEGVWQLVVEELKYLGEQEVLITCYPAEAWRF